MIRTAPSSRVAAADEAREQARAAGEHEEHLPDPHRRRDVVHAAAAVVEEPHPLGLGPLHLRERDRLRRRVVDEVLARLALERLVARQIRVALGEDLQRVGGRDLVRLHPAVLGVAARAARLEVLLHADRRAAARQVGADEQRRRAALGDRDEAALLARGVDRPRRQHDRGRDPPPSPTCSSAGRSERCLHSTTSPPIPAIRNGTGSRSVRVRIASANSAPAVAQPHAPRSSLQRERERGERREQQERAERLGQLVAGRADQRRIGADDRPGEHARPTARRGSRPAPRPAPSSRS